MTEKSPLSTDAGPSAPRTHAYSNPVGRPDSIVTGAPEHALLRTGARPVSQSARPRVVQRSGPSSYVVTLPFRWLKAEGIGEGDLVRWDLEEDGSLRLIPEGPQRTPRGGQDFHFEEEHFRDPTYPCRIMTSAYVLGYDRVRVSDRQGFDPEVRALLEESIHDLPGFELTSVNPHEIVATSFLDPTAHPVKQVIARLGMALDLLLAAVEAALTRGSPDALDPVPRLVREIERLNALSMRQLNLAAGNSSVARALEVRRPSQLLGNRVVVQLMRDVAEATVSIGAALARGPSMSSAARPVLEELASRMSRCRDRLRQSTVALQSESRSATLKALSSGGNGLDDHLASTAHLRLPRATDSDWEQLAHCSWWIGIVARDTELIADVAFTRSLDSLPPG